MNFFLGHVTNCGAAIDVLERGGGRVLGALPAHGLAPLRHARVLHPGISKADPVPIAPRANHEEVPAKAEKAFRQKWNRHGHLYSKVVLPVFLR